MGKTADIVVIADDLEYNDLEFVVEGLYNQEFPSFEILLKEKNLKLLDENLKQQENVHVLPERENTLNEYIEHCQGRVRSAHRLSGGFQHPWTEADDRKTEK